MDKFPFLLQGEWIYFPLEAAQQAPRESQSHSLHVSLSLEVSTYRFVWTWARAFLIFTASCLSLRAASLPGDHFEWQEDQNETQQGCSEIVAHGKQMAAQWLATSGPAMTDVDVADDVKSCLASFSSLIEHSPLRLCRYFASCTIMLEFELLRRGSASNRAYYLVLITCSLAAKRVMTLLYSLANSHLSLCCQLLPLSPW